MPQLPRYDSQQNISAQPATPMLSGAGAEEENLGKAVDQVGAIATKWGEALDTIQYTQAKAQYETGVAELEARAIQDPDINATDKYFKELKKIKDQSISGIQNKTVQSTTALQLETDTQINQLKIGNIFKKKQIIVGQVALQTSVEALQKKILNSTSPEEAAKLSAEISDMLKANVKSGVIGYADMAKVEKEVKENIRIGIPERDMFANPQAFKNNVKKGIYDLTAKEQTEMTIKADRLIKAQESLVEWETKKANTQGAFELASDMMNKTLTPEKIRKLQSSGVIDSTTAAIFDRSVFSGGWSTPDTTNLSKPEYFLDLLERAADNKTEALQIIKDATEAYGKNDMQENQYGYFITEAQKKFDRQSKGVSLGDAVLHNAIVGVKSFALSLSNPVSKKNSITASLLGRFIENLQSGKSPDKAKSLVIEEHLNTEIENAKVVIPPQTVRMEAPDGRLFDVAADKVDAALSRGLKRAGK